MIRGWYTGASGMNAQQNRLDAISNNLANVDTTGYKRDITVSKSFSELLIRRTNFDGVYETSVGSADAAPIIGKLGLGVETNENYTDFSQGSLRDTGNTYDIALAGDGFLNIEFTNKAGETSTKYTRDGGLTLTKDGYLTTKDGDYVLGENGRIQLSTTAGNTVIMEDGSIYQDDVLVTKLKITEFEDTNYLTHYGESMWDAKEGAVANDATDFRVHQGYVEMSNISVVTEMVNMISIQRQYEANQKLITTYDESLDKSVNQIGRV